ncbi:MAG: hypothetical protein DMD58_06205 [Gemmatimonadetes bacterium]|nr:MAG: hypothetical protein DMD58_06205 [Gemmatimonadota bacterium]
MEYRDAGLEQRRAQVGIKARQLGTDEERLIDDGAARQRAHEDGQTGARRAPLDHATREVEAPLPHLGVAGTGRRTHEHLPDRRLARRGERAEHGGVDGHDAPPEHRHAEPHQHGFDQVDGEVTRGRGLRQEEHAQRHALDGSDAQQAMGDLRQDAGAVAGLVVRRGAAMGEPGDGREGHRQDIVGAIAVGARDEADATGVALAPRIEQTKSPLC